MSEHNLTIALIGNPNAGKTTVFNAMTGARQHVGNWPGVTVEKKEGVARHRGQDINVVDLPGIYSLTAYSAEEIVSRNYLMDDGGPDVVIDIIDASNLERNLYLATQLLELGVRLVLAFNMSDVARSRGTAISIRRLSALLGVPIVRTVGHKGGGIEELLDAAVAVATDPRAVERQRMCDYGSEIEPHVRQMTDLVRQAGASDHSRWYGVKLLEGDEQTAVRLRGLLGDTAADTLIAKADPMRQHLQKVCGDAMEIVDADRRYGFISGACSEAVRQTVESRHDRSDRIDKVMINRFLGLPIFGAMMFLVFQMTFWLGNPLVGVLDGWKSDLAGVIRGMPMLAGQDLLRSLLADGIVEGVGAVLAFVPMIMLLYLAIAIMEDSGYMARAAFVLDDLMHHVGLHGKSFIPMLMGFGCTVPAVMATRILESRRDRLITMLVLPLFSCGARLPVYVLILGAFFSPHTVLGILQTGVDANHQPHYMINITNQAVVLFAIYAIGVTLAVIGARLLAATVFRGEATPFVMELPPYRMPAPRGLAIHTWERAGQYVRKAGTVILAVVVLLWAAKTWPQLDGPQRAAFETQRHEAQTRLAADEPAMTAAVDQIDLAEHREQLMNSTIGQIGRAMETVLAPCGFDWRICTGLVGSLGAKEVFIGQMAVIYSVGKEHEGGGASLQARLGADYRPLQGFCIMLFILIASPCVATVAVTAKESGLWRWALLQWSGLTALAWLVTAAAFQIGSLMGF